MFVPFKVSLEMSKNLQWASQSEKVSSFIGPYAKNFPTEDIFFFASLVF